MEKCINADKLIKTIELKYLPSDKLTAGILYDLLRTAQSIEYNKLESNTKWISIKERLPEKSGEYIVHICGGLVTAMPYSSMYNKFNVYDNCDSDSLIFRSIEVTDWMPLPQPPESEWKSND